MQKGNKSFIRFLIIYEVERLNSAKLLYNQSKRKSYFWQTKNLLFSRQSTFEDIFKKIIEKMENSTLERLTDEKMTDEEEIEIFNFDDLGNDFILELLTKSYVGGQCDFLSGCQNQNTVPKFS